MCRKIIKGEITPAKNSRTTKLILCVLGRGVRKKASEREGERERELNREGKGRVVGLRVRQGKHQTNDCKI